MDRVNDLDVIELVGVGGFGHHGVLAHETRDGQEFLVDVRLHVDIARAAAHDDLDATVDYGVVANEVHNLIVGEPYLLIETLAEHIASACLAHRAVQRVEVAVHKPHAPIMVPFVDVVLRITRAQPVKTHRVVLALGANLGDAHAALQGAVAALADNDDVDIERVSAVYSTTAVGGPEQDDYLNAVVIANTSLAPHALLALTQSVENLWHRTRTVRWGPRTLDIDIITFDDLVSDSVELTLPHPRAMERAFVLVPWADVDSGIDLTDVDQSGVVATELVLTIAPQ